MAIMLVLNPFKSSLVLLQTRKYSSIFIIMLKLFILYLALIAAYRLEREMMLVHNIVNI